MARWIDTQGPEHRGDGGIATYDGLMTLLLLRRDQVLVTLVEEGNPESPFEAGDQMLLEIGQFRAEGHVIGVGVDEAPHTGI